MLAIATARVSAYMCLSNCVVIPSLSVQYTNSASISVHAGWGHARQFRTAHRITCKQHKVGTGSNKLYMGLVQEELLGVMWHTQWAPGAACLPAGPGGLVLHDH